jgi:hypothetical protein
MGGPSREWLEKAAEAEDQCRSVSVGGLAADLGLIDAAGARWADDPARYRIWWTNGAEAKLAVAMIDEGLAALHPDLEAAIRSRRGRAGRMRLWDSGGIHVPAGLADSWPMDGPIAASLIADDSGGIVFHRCLIDQARRMPGFVTTMGLELA